MNMAGELIGEEKILLALAKAQKIIGSQAVQILRTDKTDGIRAVKWMETHRDLFFEVMEFYGISDTIKDEARRISGE